MVGTGGIFDGDVEAAGELAERAATVFHDFIELDGDEFLVLATKAAGVAVRRWILGPWLSMIVICWRQVV